MNLLHKGQREMPGKNLYLITFNNLSEIILKINPQIWKIKMPQIKINLQGDILY